MAVITFVAASKGRLVRCPTTWGWSLPFRSVRNLRNDCRRCRLPPPGVRYLHWLARMRHTFAKNPGTVLPGPEQPRSSHGSLKVLAVGVKVVEHLLESPAGIDACPTRHGGNPHVGSSVQGYGKQNEKDRPGVYLDRSFAHMSEWKRLAAS